MTAHPLAQLDPLQSVNLTADEALSPYVFVFYAAFLVSFLFTPIMRSVALHWDVVDRPDLQRKVHRQPVAYLGGVAVFLGWIIGLALSQSLQLHFWQPGLATKLDIPIPIVLGACLIVVLGLLDDIRRGGISPSTKILGQVAAAFALIVAGVGNELTEPFLRNLNDRLLIRTGAALSPDVLAVLVKLTSSALVVAIIVFCCNASNLMDGLDGLCGGVTAIIAVGYTILAVHVAANGQVFESNAAGLRVVLALALLGGVMGFVPYNFNPASIFMGDTGSMLLGFCCGLMIIMLGQVEAKWLLAALVMFSLPVLDTALAFARRWVNRRPLFSADKFHFHHQLMARGLGVRQAVLTAYGLAIFFVLCGLAIVFMRTRYAVGFYLVLFGCIIVTAYKMGMIHEKPQKVERSGLGDDEKMQAAIAGTEGVIEITAAGSAEPAAARGVSSRPG
jgi:UDP-GlcNAc:undecaprenyl-phosphate GlcNAc-1-phosphate transferase